jgi:hypothetical protein
VLIDPRGVTVDNDGYVYVTSYNSNSVVVLEPDGRHGRQILSSNGGLKMPTGSVSVIVCLIYLLSTCCYIGVRRQVTLFN